MRAFRAYPVYNIVLGPLKLTIFIRTDCTFSHTFSMDKKYIAHHFPYFVRLKKCHFRNSSINVLFYQNSKVLITKLLTPSIYLISWTLSYIVYFMWANWNTSVVWEWISRQLWTCLIYFICLKQMFVFCPVSLGLFNPLFFPWSKWTKENFPG